MLLDEGALGVLWERVVYLFEPDINFFFLN
jgi:hypothetical protein